MYVHQGHTHKARSEIGLQAKTVLKCSPVELIKTKRKTPIFKRCISQVLAIEGFSRKFLFRLRRSIQRAHLQSINIRWASAFKRSKLHLLPQTLSTTCQIFATGAVFMQHLTIRIGDRKIYSGLGFVKEE